MGHRKSVKPVVIDDVTIVFSHRQRKSNQRKEIDSVNLKEGVHCVGIIVSFKRCGPWMKSKHLFFNVKKYSHTFVSM